MSTVCECRCKERVDERGYVQLTVDMYQDSRVETTPRRTTHIAPHRSHSRSTDLCHCLLDTPPSRDMCRCCRSPYLAATLPPQWSSSQSSLPLSHSLRCLDKPYNCPTCLRSILPRTHTKYPPPPSWLFYAAGTTNSPTCWMPAGTSLCRRGNTHSCRLCCTCLASTGPCITEWSPPVHPRRYHRRKARSR